MMKRKTFIPALLCALLMLSGCRDDGGLTSPAVTGESGDTGEYIEVPDITSGELLDYFNEVAIGSEYGESTEVICKWTKKISYTVTGNYTEGDMELIESLCDRLNGIEGFPGIGRALIPSTADFEISFVPRAELAEMFDAADESCAGMAEYSWDRETGEIISARAGIDEALGEERASTVCEEFLQALGPAKDSYKYLTSVFYESRSLVPQPAEVDWAIMEILYSPAITPGMGRRDAVCAAAALLKW